MIRPLILGLFGLSHRVWIGIWSSEIGIPAQSAMAPPARRPKAELGNTRKAELRLDRCAAPSSRLLDERLALTIVIWSSELRISARIRGRILEGRDAPVFPLFCEMDGGAELMAIQQSKAWRVILQVTRVQNPIIRCQSPFFTWVESAITVQREYLHYCMSEIHL
jgi:hypothetical protein